MKDIVLNFGSLSRLDNNEWRYVWNDGYSNMANIRLDSKNTSEQAYNKVLNIIEAKFGKQK